MPSIAPAPRKRHSSRTSSFLPKAYTDTTRLVRAPEDELAALWNRFTQTRDPALRNDLLELYLPLVRSVAERMHLKLPSHVDIEELIQAGVFGLMDAIDAFDPRRGVRFEAYCRTRVAGAILDDLRDQDFAPRLVRTHSHRLERAIKDIEAEAGCAPTDAEVAQRLGISLEELDRWLREISIASIVSLDRGLGDNDADNEVRASDTVEDRRGAQPLSAVARKELLKIATQALSPKEQLVLILYYLEDITMKDIGLLLELSESRVCQIHNKVVGRLQAQLGRVRDDLFAA